MAAKRDHLFPATSIGRTQGSRLQRVPSNDSLTAHPLLSSSHPSSPSSEHILGSTTANGTSSQRYIPYTPRQRVSPTAATTGTTVHPSSPQHQHGDATSKLQLVSLKAAAQNMGLDTGSVGWAILETLISVSDPQDAEWREVWTAITSGKSTLLLPLEQASSQDKLTVGFVKDHIVLCDGPSRDNAPIVTLSGLRGTLNDQTLTFRTTIHPSSKIFQDLLVPSTRSSTLASLPDLQLPLSSLSPPTSLYPAFTLPSYSSSLPIPPRALVPPLTKPPLPPRPANRTVSSSINTPAAPRISNPFASLFGGSTISVTHPKSTTVTTTSVPLPASPTPSILSLESHHSQTEHVIDVSGFTIDRSIIRKELAKDMNKALRKHVKDALNAAALPSWVIDRVHDFTAEWYPFVKDDPSSVALSRKTREKVSKQKLGNVYDVTYTEEAPERTAERIQDFYLGLEQDLRVWGSTFLGRGRKDHDTEGEKSAGLEDERRVREKIDSEAKIKEVMDVVERTICSMFYDRLYRQPTSDDSSHDEALSSRVAALNMLDLGLEHLDIHVENPGPELEAVVKACGQMLSQLDSCSSPGDKATILVAAHKIIVDGLSRLPPIRLMSEEESRALKAKSSTITRAKSEAPPRGVDGKLNILIPVTSELPTSDMLEAAEGEKAKHTSETVENAHVLPPQSSLVPTIVEPDPESQPDSDPIEVSSPTPYSPPSPIPRVLTMSPTPEATPISGDVLLPMIIFSVVKANPPHLVSNLLYTQRFRNQSVGGEESYCLINLMAVAEFLENVDLAALGLGDSDKVVSAADLTPIPLNRSPRPDEQPLTSVDGLPASLRDRVEQANKVITGVVDSSFGMLRSLLPTATAVAPLTPPISGEQGSAPWNAAKPGFGLLRRETGFSIKSITAALPMNRGGARSGGEEVGQQLVTVSRPGSVKSLRAGKGEEEERSDLEGESVGDSDEDEEGEHEDGEDDDMEEGVNDDASAVGDTRSIRSFESMLSGKKKRKKDKFGSGARKSLTDRLAHMSNLAGLKGSPPPRASLLPQSTQPHTDTPASSRPPSPISIRIAPPIQRFVDCTPGDLRLSEVGELLRDYRRLVESIRAVGGFDE